MDALGSPWCDWDQPWGLILLTFLLSLGFTAHHWGAWGGSAAGQCSQQWDVQDRSKVGERNGMGGGEGGAGSCSLAS